MIRNPFKRYTYLTRARGDLAHVAAAIQQAKAAADGFLQVLDDLNAAADVLPAVERRQWEACLDALELEQLANLGTVLQDRLTQAIEVSIGERADWPDPEADEK